MPFFGGGGGDYHIVVTNIKGGTNAAPALVGNNNMALGNASLQNAALADKNIAIGNNALVNIIDKTNNVGIGVISDTQLTDIDGSVLVGNNTGVTISGDSVNDGNIADSVIIGVSAGQVFNTSGAVPVTKVVLIGQSAGDYTTGILSDIDGSIAIGYNARVTQKNQTVIGRSSGSAAQNAVVVGANSFAEYDSVILGHNLSDAFLGSCIEIGGTQTQVRIGAYDLSAIPLSGGTDFWVTDYVSVGENSNSANVNGSVVSAKIAAWIDNGGTDEVGLGIGKADTTADAGATMFLGRSRGTLAAQTIVSNNDRLGSIVAVGNDSADFAVSSRINFEVDGTPGVNDMPGRIVFATSPDGSHTAAEVARITQNKYFRMATGSLGIQFNGDTAAANALDDYEEGTFTPVLTCASPGDLAVTVLSATGIYRKIGDTVFCWIQLGTFSFSYTTATGQFRISGLPFTVNGSFRTGSALVGGWTAPANYTAVGSSAQNSNTYITLQRMSINAGAISSVNITEFASGGSPSIFAAFSYQA